MSKNGVAQKQVRGREEFLQPSSSPMVQRGKSRGNDLWLAGDLG